MDLQNLEENKEQILREFLEERNAWDLKRVRCEINWLLSKADSNSWADLEDAYRERISGRHYSEATKNNKKSCFRYISMKLYPGSVFMRPAYRHYEDPGEMLRLSIGYRELGTEYRALLDAYAALAQKAGKKRDTVFSHCSLASRFLRHLQDMGADSLEEADEKAVMSFFYADSQYERQIRSYSYKEKLAVVFKTCAATDRYGTGCRRILNMIPAFRYVRKNVAYLTEDEARAIRNSIDSDEFSLLERAAMMLLLYTGMRSCDVAAIRLRDIDWEAETISIVQQKTAEPLTVAMLPAVGNAVFEYLQGGFPASPSEYLFGGEGSRGGHISAKNIRAIAYKAYRLAGIRQNKGERRGTHLFRHHAATKMLENGVQRPVISRALGHADPASLETYLHADFKHLREFALSLDPYPVPEEAWNI